MTLHSSPDDPSERAAVDAPSLRDSGSRESDGGSSTERSPEAPAGETTERSSAPLADEAARPASLLRFGLPSLALAGSLGALEMARSRFQRSRVFVPTRYPAGEWDPSTLGLDFEDVEFASEDGTRLHGWWLPRERARATIVFCHGNSGSIAVRLPVYRHLLRLGFAIFAFDYRGYGRSDGVPSRRGVFADARSAFDHVVTEREVPLDRLLLLGHSLGGAVAIETALHRPAAGLIVQASFTQLRDMARHRFPDLPPMHWITRNEFRSIEKVPHLEMPSLFVHGDADETVPFAHGRALFEAAAEPKRFLPIRGGGHNDLHLMGGLPYARALRRFERMCRKLAGERLARERLAEASAEEHSSAAEQNPTTA